MATLTSEIISIVLEPIANSQPGSLEENATDGFLANLTKLNKRLASQELVRKGTQSCTSSHRDQPDPVIQDRSLPLPQGEGRMATGGQPNNPVSSQKEDKEEFPSQAISNQKEDEEKLSNQEISIQIEENPPPQPILMKKNDIRMFLKRRDNEWKDPVLVTDTRASSRIEDQPKESKMNMIRRKMTESRRKKEQQESGNIAIVKKHPEAYKGQKLIAARDLEKGAAQDILEVVVVGADVAALYPSLSDLEVGIICHDDVMNTNIKFNNINYSEICLHPPQ